MSPYIAGLRSRIGHARLLLPSVTGIVYDQAGAILLVRIRESGVWTTPGGAIDPDETPADALVREVREETGLEVRPERLLGVFGGPAFVIRYPNGDESQYVMVVFECRVVGGEARPDDEETTELRYVSRDELASLPTSPWLREVLPLLYPRPERPLFTPPREDAAPGS
jgi:ADP-ribose pyrophosphatase YjhB (NUDIX family)